MGPNATSGETASRRREYLLLYALCVVLLGSLAALWASQRGFLRREPVVEHHVGDAAERPIDLNTAPWWELTVIRGIGEKRAKDIVELRERKKGFQSIEELSEIRGITPEIIEEMRRKVRIEPR